MAVSWDAKDAGRECSYLEEGLVKCDTDDDEDDWLFRSVKCYENLHMYELHQPTQTIEWITNDSICVACQLTNGQSELLQLAVPSALLSTKQSICSETDFRLTAGGFHDRQIVSLKHIPNSRTLVSAEKNRNCITLWKTPDLTSETDSCMIRKSGRIENIASTSRAAVIDACDSLVAFGDATTNICVYDVHTSQCVFDTCTGSGTNEPVSRLLFTDERCLLSCGWTSGILSVWDLRTGLLAFELPRGGHTSDSCSLNHTHMAWTCDPLTHSTPVTKLLLLASDGHVSVTDVRSGCQNHEILSLSTSQTFSHDHMTIRASYCEELFTVSGTGSVVNVYTLSSAGDKEVKPLFVHTGHRPIAGMTEPTVWTTCWQPGCVPNSVLSAASDGSLHAWQFIPGSY